MRYSNRAILSFVASLWLTVGSQSALHAEPDNVNITEPRNAATGFVIALWMANVDALKEHCSKLKGEAGAVSIRAITGWQDRNSPYVRAVMSYMVTVEDFVSSKGGEEARQKFRQERKAEFIKSVHDMEAVWFPNAQVDDQSCTHLANEVASGALDVDQNKDFLPTLKQIRADMEKGN